MTVEKTEVSLLDPASDLTRAESYLVGKVILLLAEPWELAKAAPAAGRFIGFSVREQ